MSAKHIATAPLFGTNPFSGGFTNRQIGTRYFYSIEDIEKSRKAFANRGHPFRLRWRNEECRIAALRARAHKE